jgi:hypothetical protein
VTVLHRRRLGHSGGSARRSEREAVMDWRKLAVLSALLLAGLLFWGVVVGLLVLVTTQT